MRGLTDIERAVLSPGPPGEGPFPDAVFVALVERGCAAWVPDPDGQTFFTPTDLGYLALRVDAAARS